MSKARVSPVPDWVIDSDHLGTHQVGRRRSKELLCVVPFRVFDDAGTLYYEGRLNQSRLDGVEAVAFDVLNYYTAWAGATRLEYMNNGGWQTL